MFHKGGPSGAKDMQPQFSQLADALGGAYEWQYTPEQKYRYIASVALMVDGVPFTIFPVTGSKGGFMGVRFHTQIASPVTSSQITLRKETTRDRVGKQLRINREYESGDAAFDNEVYVETDASDLTLTRIFREPSARHLTRVALQNGIKEIELASTRGVGGKLDLHVMMRTLTFTVAPGNLGRVQDLRRALSALAAWHAAIQGAADLPAGPYGRGGPVALEPPLPGRTMRGVVVFLIGALVWLVLIIKQRPPTFGYDAWFVGLGVGVIFWFAALVIFVALFRGRSTSFRTVLTAFFWYFGVVITSVVFAESLNGSLDTGPRNVEVARVATRAIKNGTRKVLILPEGRIDAPSESYSSLEVGGLAKVTMGRGALGSRWVEHVTPVK